MSLIRAIARPLLASSFILSGVERIRTADETAENLGFVLRPVANSLPAVDEKTVARVLGGVQVGAGILLGLGKCTRFSGLLLALTSGVNAAAEYGAADSSTPQARGWQRAQLLKNVSLFGAVLLAAVDSSGRKKLKPKAALEALPEAVLHKGSKAAA
ncbi:DoxX family protein [Psychromicrobium xiongbiense]|uniref:DoxX family protein n=1 Tax=Psychromicrobium xiongbiense TaxID=3051184 RepID=UPI002556568A|nr:DoxX family membrane protein [Psychromicrobium sp. YIM S02556]